MPPEPDHSGLSYTNENDSVVILLDDWLADVTISNQQPQGSLTSLEPTVKFTSIASSSVQLSLVTAAVQCLPVDSEDVEDGMSEEFGMMFDILFITPDSVRTKALYTHNVSAY